MRTQQEKELWRDIPGFDYYQISNKANVRSLPREIIRKNGKPQRFRRSRILKVNRSPRRNYVALYRGDGVAHFRSIPELMMEAFGSEEVSTDA
jgi:hypothetical protein